MLFEKDRRISVPVEADFYDRLVKGIKLYSPRLTISRLVRRMTGIFLDIESHPNSQLILRVPGKDDVVLMKSILTQTEFQERVETS